MSSPANYECCIMRWLLLCILFLSCSSVANASAGVQTTLPGFEGPLPFYLETGYIVVDKENGTELFYYFIESEGNPGEDPLIYWLTGGPGCSGFSALVFEIGPLRFFTEEYDGTLPKLVYHPYALTKVANIIFVDAPVGTGFSFSRNPLSYNVGDLSSAEQTYQFLLQWFIEHPQFLKTEFYVSGDSYAGKVVPLVAQKVFQGMEAGTGPLINLKGYSIGNPLTGETIDHYARFPYAYSHGIISHEFSQRSQTKCQGQNYVRPATIDCANCVKDFEKVISEIEQNHILERKCARDFIKLNGISHRTLNEKELDELDPAVTCRSYGYTLSNIWANSKVTREALNIKEGTLWKWERCVMGIPYDTDELASSIPIQYNLTSRGYRALVYSGDQDIVIPFLGTYEWIRSLNFPVTDDWRSWHVDGQVAGYTVTYSNNLTFATVKGAGHTAPEYKPKECLAMFHLWLSYKSI